MYFLVHIIKNSEFIGVQYRAASSYKIRSIRISFAHNKGGPAAINIAQILHLSNFFEFIHRVYIHLQA
jgi:hypothetical protein